uniref:Uncharacterized protein n=1 Tax=viral metagenome TaxID=1070528 RepID=A0A6M3IJX9_9ZZZZ
MGITIKNAYIGQPPAANTTLYTCPANTQARVLKCTATNDTTTAQTISFHKVPSGDAVGDDVLIMNSKAIGPKETYECPEVVGQVLDAGDLLSAIAGGANQITVSLDVVEIV